MAIHTVENSSDHCSLAVSADTTEDLVSIRHYFRLYSIDLFFFKLVIIRHVYAISQNIFTDDAIPYFFWVSFEVVADSVCLTMTPFALHALVQYALVADTTNLA